MQNFVKKKLKSRLTIIQLVSPPCVSFSADCFPEKTVQILVEAREHSREILHHGKPFLSSPLSRCPDRAAGPNLAVGSRPSDYWKLMPQLFSYPHYSFPSCSFSPLFPFCQDNFDPSTPRKN